MDALTDVTKVLLGLDDLLLEEHDLEAALATVLEVGLEAFDEEPAISLTISQAVNPEQGWSTRQASTDWARELDEWQYEHGEGPCLEADSTARTCVVQDLGADDRFPAFARVAAEHGVVACVSFPMPVRGVSVGSINAFYCETDRITPEVERRGTRLAASAAPLLANWVTHRRMVTLTDQLQEALEGRSIIERAKGVLMGELGVDEDRAFELLRTQSQHQNVKLREVAARLLSDRVAGRAAGPPAAPQDDADDGDG